MLLLPNRWFTLCSRCLGRQFQELASISLKQMTASRHSLRERGDAAGVSGGSSSSSSVNACC